MAALTKRLLLLLAVLVVWEGAALAAPEEAPLVASIDVDGNRFVEKGAILARLQTRVGKRLDRKALSEDIRQLYQSGDFSYIRVTGRREGDKVHLRLHVKEYPLIAHVRLLGNEEVKSKDLKKRLKLKPGYVFSPKLMRHDLNVIRKGYLKKGFYQVQVDFVPHQLGDGRVDVDIKIDEGRITRIQRILFIGNKAFSDAELRDAIASRTSDWLTWFTDRDVFDQQRFAADGQMILEHYQNHGYLDAKIESSMLSLVEDKQYFNLTLAIDEGPQYRIGRIALRGDVVPDEATLSKLIKLQKGDIYSLRKLRESISALTERVGDEGYAFATVTPLFKRDLSGRTVDIEFDIEKGDEIYIERIEISGNEKTEDSVVRRELKQSEAARYSASQINRSKEALLRSPLFSDVRISLPRGSDGHKVNMEVEVTERKTGSFSFGIGYSQVEKTLFQSKLSENNLFGKGYQAQLNGTIGAQTQNYNASFTDPYFLGKNMSASVNIFEYQADPLATFTYQQNAKGGGVGFGVPLSDHVQYGIQYQYSSTTLSGLPAGASVFLFSQLGTQTVGELSQTLSWDSRDKFIAPTKGHYDFIRASFAGVGGSNRFWELEASSSAYFSFGEEREFTLNPSFDAKMINAYGGRELLISRRYSMGGIGSIRGFDSYGISLRDQNGAAVGGDRQVRASVNLFAPIPYIRTPGFRFVLFADAGTLWGKINTQAGNQTLSISESFSLSRVRSSAGFGFEWISPIGPLSFVWGFPIRKVAGDIPRRFEFALGAAF